jgi:hypothetical protein
MRVLRQNMPLLIGRTTTFDPCTVTVNESHVECPALQFACAIIQFSSKWLDIKIAYHSSIGLFISLVWRNLPFLSFSRCCHIFVFLFFLTNCIQTLSLLGLVSV